MRVAEQIILVGGSNALGGAGESVVVPAAPGLTWNSLETDNEPDFLVDLPSGNVDPDQDAAAGDHLIIEYQLQAGGAWTGYVDRTLIAGDITDDTITVTGVGTVANGSYYFRDRIERGALIGTNSANEAVTINAVLVPVNSVAPVISGNTQVGQTLTTTDGTWSNTPTSYAYQWKRDGASIGGATANTRVLAELDAGADITCEVTASNAAGAGTPAASNTLGIDVYVVFLASIVDGTDATTYSAGVWNGVSLGVAAANRMIVIAPMARNSGAAGVVASASVAGTALAVVIASTGATATNKAEIWNANIAAGTTGDISITWSLGQQRCGCGVWAVYGAGSATASDTDKTDSASAGSVTLTVPAKGVAIGVSMCTSAASSCTWVGLTENYDAIVEAGAVYHSGASLNSNAGGNIAISSTWAGTVGTFGGHAFASWGP
jgi:hypothetical protein